MLSDFPIKFRYNLDSSEPLFGFVIPRSATTLKDKFDKGNSSFSGMLFIFCKTVSISHINVYLGICGLFLEIPLSSLDTDGCLPI